MSLSTGRVAAEGQAAGAGGRASWRHRLFTTTQSALRAVTDKVDLLAGPVTYNEDGLATRHAAGFLDDPRFAAAYQRGRATGSWKGADVRWRCYVCCWAAAQALHLDGDLVECGVYRGGYSRAIVEYADLRAAGRTLYLLDTFCGLVDSGISPEDRAWGRRPGGFEECYDDVARTFAGFPVRLVRGPIPETLAQVDAPRVAYLSVDLNCTPPEIAALEFFWPRLVPGAIVVHDDYGFQEYAPQRAAVDAFAARQGVEVLTLPTGQGLLVKPPVGREARP